MPTNKLIRNIPDEVVEELERRAKDMGMQFGTYARLLLIHAARQERSAIKEWASTRDTPSMPERDRYQLAIDTGTVEQYHEDLRREAFRRDEQKEE